MSHSLSTSQVETNLGQNHFGSVAVAPVGVSAELAHKNSFGAFKWLLGSRRTTRTRHRCVSGRHYHHRSTRPLGKGNQFAFRLPDRVVGCFTRHRGFEQEFGAEVLHGDHLMSGNDFASPLPRRVLALARDFLVNCGGLFLRGRVTVRSCFAGFGFTAGHSALIFRELHRGGFRILGSLEIELGLGRGRDSGHTPIDPDHGINLGQYHVIDSYNETRVPVTETVPENRTLDGSLGSSRDHTTGISQPPASRRRPSLMLNPLREYCKDGRSRFFLKLRLPAPAKVCIVCSWTFCEPSRNQPSFLRATVKSEPLKNGLRSLREETIWFHSQRRRCHSAFNTPAACAPGRSR